MAPDLDGADFSKARVAAAYDLLAPRWDTHHLGPRVDAENRLVFDALLARRGYLDGRVLELCCGTGLLLDYAGHRVRQGAYVGLDISSGMIARARSKHPGRYFRQLDVDSLADTARPLERGAVGLRDASFDSAVCVFAGWSYVLRPLEVARALRRLLRPGGKLFLMAYGPGARAAGEYRYADAAGAPIARHIWTAGEMRECVAAAGFGAPAAFGLVSAGAARAIDRHAVWPEVYAYARLSLDYLLRTRWDAGDSLFVVGTGAAGA